MDDISCKIATKSTLCGNFLFQSLLFSFVKEKKLTFHVDLLRQSSGEQLDSIGDGD